MAQRALARGERKAIAEQRTLVWVDESGFYLLPALVRTYAPVGETPILRSYLIRDYLSAISGITPEGQIYMRVQEGAIKSGDVVRFLKHLLCHISGRLLVIWDGAPTHRGQVVKNFLADGAATRIHLERLPGYAPELNPDEGSWRYLKRVELKNLACQDLAHLHSELRKATHRLRRKPEIIQGCIRQPGYYYIFVQRSAVHYIRFPPPTLDGNPSISLRHLYDSMRTHPQHRYLDNYTTDHDARGEH